MLFIIFYLPNPLFLILIVLYEFDLRYIIFLETKFIFFRVPFLKHLQISGGWFGSNEAALL